MFQKIRRRGTAIVDTSKGILVVSGKRKIFYCLVEVQERMKVEGLQQSEN